MHGPFRGEECRPERGSGRWDAAVERGQIFDEKRGFEPVRAQVSWYTVFSDPFISQRNRVMASLGRGSDKTHSGTGAV